jgi:ABC transporter substrate binding protein (PQQ-dependent alcohol dehydrogenase system)
MFQSKMLAKLWLIFASFLIGIAPGYAGEFSILYLQQEIKQAPALSNILPEPKDSGLKGAELAIKDNNSAGRFLKQHYTLEVFSSDQTDALIQHASNWVQNDRYLIVADMPAETLLKLMSHEPIKQQAIVFNATAQDNALRHKSCQPGLLHTAPSRAMLTDALMQFLAFKRWKNLFLVQGGKNQDQHYAASLQRSAKRFGLNIVADKTWTFDTDLRRSALKEIPAFTQAKDHDAVLVADESGDFGEYLPYNTWLPRPVVGTQGLKPVAWHRVVEQWGAAQLQRRFEKLAKRWMNSKDYGAWLAVRSIAEAITRTPQHDKQNLYTYLVSDKFELAGFKGRKLNFRTWNGQMRQPIPLIHPRALVANAPLEGFLHPRSELDSLGYDEPEVDCKF